MKHEAFHCSIFISTYISNRMSIDIVYISNGLGPGIFMQEIGPVRPGAAALS